MYWENILDPGEHRNCEEEREGHNPAWMKALCIITSSVLPLHHHQETKDKSKYSTVKPKCYVLILFCQNHFRLSAHQYIMLESPTEFGIFTPQCIYMLSLCLCWMAIVAVLCWTVYRAA